ncbi:MAG: 50S ribosomal protein L29 [Patescibacteria group bacterium]
MAKKTTETGKNAALLKLDRAGLVKELNDSRRALYLLQMKKVAGELKETHQVKLHKKHVARVLTFLSVI